MGEVAGAGLLAHVPTIMLPYSERLELNEGKEISLVPGLERLRAEVFETLDYDTVVVLDSHWHTTVEFVVSAQATRAGLFTSDELPRGMVRIPYDWPGDPELAHAIAAQADAHGTWITAIDDPCLPDPLRHRQPVAATWAAASDKRWVSVSTARPATPRTSCGRGGRSARPSSRRAARPCCWLPVRCRHTFWSLRELRAHEASDTVHIRTAEARAADLERIAGCRRGSTPG